MSWGRLLARGILVRHQTSLQEMNAWRTMIARDLEDASVPELSSDRSFGIGYGAVFVLAKMVLSACGYRVKGEGAHRATLEALGLAMGSPVDRLQSYFDTCRRKRNQLNYDVAGSVSRTEANELRARAEVFRGKVELWIRRNHPHLVSSR